jgi:hypothetical protein
MNQEKLFIIRYKLKEESDKFHTFYFEQKEQMDAFYANSQKYTHRYGYKAYELNLGSMNVQQIPISA